MRGAWRAALDRHIHVGAWIQLEVVILKLWQFFYSF